MRWTIARKSHGVRQGAANLNKQTLEPNAYLASHRDLDPTQGEPTQTKKGLLGTSRSYEGRDCRGLLGLAVLGRLSLVRLFINDS